MQVKFVLGDWSDDGHGHSEEYLVSTNRTVEEIREAHFLFKDLVGFDIGDIASGYEEPWLKTDQAVKLQAAGIKFSDLVEGTETIDAIWGETTFEDLADDLSEEDLTFEYYSSVLELWFRCLRYVDPKMFLEVDNKKDSIPTVHFYGRDKENRHLRTPGYGFGY